MGLIVEDLTFVSLESWKERKKKATLKIFREIINENFPNLAKGISLQIQEAEQTLDRISQKNSTSTQLVVVLIKTQDKENTLKTACEKRHLTGESYS